jgi:N-acetyl-anhydromuramyl-L-alanine amidase AmpD
MAGAARILLVGLIVGVAAWLSLPAAASPERAVRAKVPAPKAKWDPIPYDKARKRQMANYSKRHYGKREWRLENPRAIVLHYTAGSSYESAFNTFASNGPNNGERPGVCSQFVVDKDGTIYQLTRLYVRCRHAIGLNHVSIGIELVQEEVGGSHATSQAILDRRAQARAAVRLAAWLRTRYRIASRDLIGHAMVNDSRFFKDKQGWRNDHTDWPKAEVKTFRKRVIRKIREHKRNPSVAHRG